MGVGEGVGEAEAEGETEGVGGATHDVEHVQLIGREPIVSVLIEDEEELARQPEAKRSVMLPNDQVLQRQQRESFVIWIRHLRAALR